MSESIYTPRVCIDMALHDPSRRNQSMCTKIPHLGYVISIAMDSSHRPGDLSRSDIRIYDARDIDVTGLLMPDHGNVVRATAESLKEALAAIEEQVALPA